MIYKVGGPALADCGAVYLSQIFGEWVVIYVYEYHLHSVGCTVAVYFHCYAFCISCMLWLIIFGYHWFSSRYQIGLDCVRIFILFRSILESCLTYWGRYTDINDLTTAEMKKSWVARDARRVKLGGKKGPIPWAKSEWDARASESLHIRLCRTLF